MKLLVIRHAIAMEREEYQSKARAEARLHGADPAAHADDDLRPLTEPGARKMKKNAKGIRNLSMRPQLLISSSLTRALQTAEILREVAWPDLDLATTEHLSPGAEPGELCKWIRELPPTGKHDCVIALVGHEPHLSSLVSWFMSGSQKSQFELKKGGACLLDFASTFDKGRGRLEWLATPSMLKSCR